MHEYTGPSGGLEALNANLQGRVDAITETVLSNLQGREQVNRIDRAVGYEDALLGRPYCPPAQSIHGPAHSKVEYDIGWESGLEDRRIQFNVLWTYTMERWQAGLFASDQEPPVADDGANYDDDSL
jgi:hypothetical protein